MEKKRGQWTSSVAFILAAAGSAVGLGNIWKFPGRVGANGGGLFLVSYIFAVALIGFTVMLAELSLGRNTQRNIVGTFKKLSPKWTFIGKLSIIATFVIISYYCVVGGWVLKYISVYLTGADFGGNTQDFFVNFITSPIQPILWFIVYCIANAFIVIKGISHGIERVTKIFMPLLFLILIMIIARSLTLEGASDGLKFMFAFNIAEYKPSIMIAAIGQAFFSLSLGMSIMITYGSYVPKTENLEKSAAFICFIDTVVALLAAFAIIPAVFAMKADLGMGGGFAFIAIPNVFAGMPGGLFFGLLFFLLLFFAAFTSSISLLEAIVAYVCEEWGFTRLNATVLITIGMIFIGSVYSLSQGAMNLKLPWFDFGTGFVFDAAGNVMEKFTDNLMLPLIALLTCLFVSYVWKTKTAISEVEQEGKFKFVTKKLWVISVKYICPIALVIILFYTIGLGIGVS